MIQIILQAKLLQDALTMLLKPARLVILVCALSVLTAGTSFAQDYEQLFKRCFTDGLPDHVIVSCSAVIARKLADKQDLATAYKNRGNAYDDKGEYARALEDYDEAVRINPLDADAFNSRGTTYSALGQYERSILDFDTAIKLNPTSPMSFNNRCFAKGALDELDQGLADCDKALHLKPNNTGALRSRAFIYLKQKRYDAAIADYNQVLRMNREDAYALYGRGLAKQMKGDWRGGDGDIVAAQALKPDIADYMAKLGIRLQAL